MTEDDFADLRKQVDLLHARLRDLRREVSRPLPPGDVHLLLTAHRLVLRALLGHAKIKVPFDDADFRRIGAVALHTADKGDLPPGQNARRVRTQIQAEIRRLLFDFMPRDRDD